ncbi:Gmad2 immunoglobulin-like domain-containing protein [Egicoccus halophilus]|uniref:Bacterial spore germination immunoglobulin-like domain-containing protein n=1 Tax=Egicoccus halophilus TaxID=1670830 RepID=A0A8J3A9F0_9ACTN|nr:Gmad2 immunoglobulin-like domain-containing protein [Egicoccus halophilus]GGI05116.1 hypothetical protein GCM10011354_12490 [Egicoccus halophilus]
MRRPVLRSLLLTTVVVLVTACGGGGGSEPSLVDPTGPADETVELPEDAPETDEAPDEEEQPEPLTEGDTAEDADEGQIGDTDAAPGADTDGAGDDATDGSAAAVDGAAAPDEAALADPCAGHQGREGEAFLEVVAPADEQQLGQLDGVELVGCSNVYEANVQWELYTGDGELLTDGFTTAECGSGCVGEFREELDLSAAQGEPFAELHVFSESPQDGSRDHLVAIPLVLT